MSDEVSEHPGERVMSTAERPTNKEIVDAVDWLSSMSSDLIEFDEAYWKDVDKTGIVSVSGYVNHEDGPHYISVDFKIQDVVYEMHPRVGYCADCGVRLDNFDDFYCRDHRD